jgi:DNA-binding transcriptional regulator YhcF (GntR family)
MSEHHGGPADRRRARPASKRARVIQAVWDDVVGSTPDHRLLTIAAMARRYSDRLATRIAPATVSEALQALARDGLVKSRGRGADGGWVVARGPANETELARAARLLRPMVERLAHNERLPTVQELANRLKVASTDTISTALRQLADEGLVQRIGRGRARRWVRTEYGRPPTETPRRRAKRLIRGRIRGLGPGDDLAGPALVSDLNDLVNPEDQVGLRTVQELLRELAREEGQIESLGSGMGWRKVGGPPRETQVEQAKRLLRPLIGQLGVGDELEGLRRLAKRTGIKLWAVRDALSELADKYGLIEHSGAGLHAVWTKVRDEPASNGDSPRDKDPA